jgi:hypothetical protein
MLQLYSLYVLTLAAAAAPASLPVDADGFMPFQN